MHKIVLTGGPCGGKTTAKSWIMSELTKRGFTPIFIDEIATNYILSGLSREKFNSNLEFQVGLVDLILVVEKEYEKSALRLNKDKTILIYDRGILDCKAFMTDEEWKEYLISRNLNEIELRDKYDGVFHLVTSAYGAEEYYTLGNNEARSETLEEARKVDDRIVYSWTGHPHLRIIDNTTDFKEKLKRLLDEILILLKEPISYEVERKYLIKKPNEDWLNNLNNCKKVEIIQTYLTCNEEEELRVRQRGDGDNFLFTKTRKVGVGLKREEYEKMLSEKEYLKELMNADPTRKQIIKTRYCLVDNSTYYEIDLYKGISDWAIMEVELKTEEEQVIIPKGIELIREVTNDSTFSNYALSKIQ